MALRACTPCNPQMVASPQSSLSSAAPGLEELDGLLHLQHIGVGLPSEIQPSLDAAAAAAAAPLVPGPASTRNAALGDLEGRLHGAMEALETLLAQQPQLQPQQQLQQHQRSRSNPSSKPGPSNEVGDCIPTCSTSSTGPKGGSVPSSQGSLAQAGMAQSKAGSTNEVGTDVSQEQSASNALPPLEKGPAPADERVSLQHLKKLLDRCQQRPKSACAPCLKACSKHL